MSEKDFRLDRRDFLKVTSGTTAGFMIVKPESVRGSRANSAVQLGIIGCGGRGTAVGASMMENTNTQVVALADLFVDRLEAAVLHFNQLSGKLGVPPVPSSSTFWAPNPTFDFWSPRRWMPCSLPHLLISTQSTWRWL